MQTVYILYECEEGNYDDDWIICVYSSKQEALVDMFTLYFETNTMFKLEEVVMNKRNSSIQITTTEDLNWLTDRPERELLKDVIREISESGESKTLVHLLKFAMKLKQYHLVRDTEYNKISKINELNTVRELSARRAKFIEDYSIPEPTFKMNF